MYENHSVQIAYTEEVLIVMAVGELDSAETSTLSP